LTIELRGAVRGADHSTNGTYVTVDSEKSVLLKGDTWRCRRFGWIGFSDGATRLGRGAVFLRLGPHETQRSCSRTLAAPRFRNCIEPLRKPRSHRRRVVSWSATSDGALARRMPRQGGRQDAPVHRGLPAVGAPSQPARGFHSGPVIQSTRTCSATGEARGQLVAQAQRGRPHFGQTAAQLSTGWGVLARSAARGADRKSRPSGCARCSRLLNGSARAQERRRRGPWCARLR